MTPTSRLTRSSSLPQRSWAGSTAIVPFVGFVLALLSMPSGLVFILAALGMLLVGIWLLEEAEAGARSGVRRDATTKAAHGTPA